MASREGFALTETLMEVLSVTGVSRDREDRLVETVRSELVRFTEDQVLHYLAADEFAESPEALAFDPAEGIEIRVSTGKAGWSATAAHEALGRSAGCAVYFGDAVPPPVPVRPAAPGEVACTD